MAAQGCGRLACVRFFFFFGVIPATVMRVHGQLQLGFISVDCGIADGSGYQDQSTSINFSSDSQYIDVGENKNVPSMTGTLPVQYRTLRSFPNGTRNCYNLRPVKPGGRYLIRAGFWYGNYDGMNRIPVFDLHIGVNFWTAVNYLSSYNGGGFDEVITVSTADSISVCLVNTGQGAPFISTLELRPILDTMYLLANPSQSLVHQLRRDYGTTSQLRYPDDPYDRVWSGYADSFGTLNSTGEVTSWQGDGFQVPSTVLRTAVTTSPPNITYDINIRSVTGSPGDRVYVVMYFAEVEQLQSNETRRMDIYGRGADGGGELLLYKNYRPLYMQADALEVNATIGDGGVYNFSISASASSTRPPIINALESFYLRPMDVLSTDRRDVDAMEEIKMAFRVKRNWMGDPCAPRAFVWDGVNCSYEASKPPRIVYLNLTSSGLTNGIPASIVNLTALTTLDLSNNRLMGAIPAFLAEIPSLKSVILTGNQLIGTIPQQICEKVQNGALSLSIEGNRNQCSQVTRRRKTFIIVAIVASVVVLLGLLVICILLWGIKQRRRPASRPSINDLHPPTRLNYSFTFSQIRSITNNFEIAIGKGGFGTVYLGYLDSETQVAVKVLSHSSSQGIKEFQAEALLLTRVHHRNLVSLLGYCDEEINLALVYEYMDQGTLQGHLSDKVDDINVLSWGQRVKIALQAAQGLDYLHNGCKPHIVHRDVKSTNILLNHNFVAKLADFGLSRAFKTDNHTHISTLVAGTPGYVDPEYYQTYRLNETSDVYSFGVVLLEIITGRPPFPTWPDKTHLVQWVHSRLECGDIGDIADAKLRGDYDTNSCWKMLEIAIACTSTPSTQRPTMSSVVSQLKECLVLPDINGHNVVFNDFDISNGNTLDALPLRVNSGIVPSAR